ncbi:MAG: hypothetical protein IKJ72_02285 [Mycoplasmataceae bacterium]|nr:hypothetical protein [Mycoplasmataceae bacterium]
MEEFKNEMWEKQIDPTSEYGFDFSGREIHKQDFQKYNSPFGWTIIALGENHFLVTNVNTAYELPDSFDNVENKEFNINNKIFSFTKNANNQWDINLIRYENVPNNNFSNVDSHNFDYFSKNNDYEKMFSEKLQEQQRKLQIALEESKMKAEQFKEELLQEKLLQNKRIKELEDKLMESEKEYSRRLDMLKNNPTLSGMNQNRQFDDIDYSYQNRRNDINENQHFDFPFDNQISSSYNKNIMEDLSKKIEEKTMQIEILEENQKKRNLARREFEQMQNSSKQEMVENKNIKLDRQVEKLWEFQFGSKLFSTDFSGRIVQKDKYKKNEEGGWDIDFYDEKKSPDIFIASIKTIVERNGRSSFSIKNFNYNVTQNNGKWEIVKTPLNQKFEYSSRKFTNIASNIRPTSVEKISGNYEFYSSLLINLIHFPLIYLNKFELFLKQSLSDLPCFKEFYVYSNENIYKNNNSNISSYARVFFKSKSIQDDIDILFISLSLKKGMSRFIENFKFTNKMDLLTFSMVLMSHKTSLKFINAQANFDLLKSNPIPARIPQEYLIIDKEYNSILKFHENDLWKKIKPFAIDWNGNVYYVCNIDIDMIHWINEQQKNNGD